MLVEYTLFGVVDKVKQSIERLQAFEPPEGYYLAFSGGKDSQTIYHLAKQSGVKFDAHYNLTTIDPPELVHFIKRNYPDVQIHRPELSMWQLIPKKTMPPTRIHRYCCEYLKEGGGMGRIVVTGVRWAESVRRKKNRGLIDLNAGASKKIRRKIMLNNDNEENRKIVEQCVMKSKHVVNPIIDWEDSDVWEYLNGQGIEYCILYDEGFERLGCVGCPMARGKRTSRDFARYPKIEKAYLRAFGAMLAERNKKGLPTNWKTPEEVMEWWINGRAEEDNEPSLFNDIDDD